MNRNFKVVWNRSLGCFTAVAEYAKSRGKSSSTIVTSGASVSATGGAPLLRLSALYIGLAAAGFNMQAVAGYEAGGGSTFLNCTRGANGAGAEARAIAIGNEGNNACASATESIAVGANVEAAGLQSTVIGNDVVASDTAAQAVIIGSNFFTNPGISTGAGGVAIGSGLSSNLDSPIANGIGSVAIGSSGNATTNG
ncbi:ESPR domain-containing protein, partial [Psychrobacter sp. T6-1]